MKKVLFVILALLIASPAFAGQFILTYPDGQQSRIIDGLTAEGSLCNDGEAQVACAKRNLILLIKQEVREYETKKAEAQAVSGVTDTDLS